MTNSEALECFESDCETCQFKGHDCVSCRTKCAISALQAWEWVSVDDRLPEPGTNILVANAKTGSQYVSHRDLIWFSPERKAYVPTSYFREFEFTHWMPLPEPPKGE